MGTQILLPRIESANQMVSTYLSRLGQPPMQFSYLVPVLKTMKYAVGENDVEHFGSEIRAQGIRTHPLHPRRIRPCAPCVLDSKRRHVQRQDVRPANRHITSIFAFSAAHIQN